MSGSFPCHAEQDKEEMKRAVLAKLPAKIDIGPVYNVDPQRRKAYSGLDHTVPTCSYACKICMRQPTFFMLGINGKNFPYVIGLELSCWA